MRDVLYVGAGGFLGALARYWVSGWVQAATGSMYPVGTAVVNITGCLAIGFLATWGESRGVLSPEARMFLLIGVLGSFTTFSTFEYEGYMLIQDGQWVAAFANAGIQLAVGFLGVWAGVALGRVL